MKRQPAKERSVLDIIALAVAALVIVIVAALLLLGVSEAPIVANWLAGSRSESPLVGIIAGHWQSDSGAVCPDGLEEVDVNLGIARRVAYILRQQGYRVEVLPEYSPKLNDYQADVFLSIHCDSCVASLSGFKIARMTHSAAPDLEDRLVEMLYDSYGRATGLSPHPNTITDHMRGYHALRRISRDTPGAIIECGFMGGDRHLLTEEQDRVAVGIANGLSAFLTERADYAKQRDS